MKFPMTLFLNIAELRPIIKFFSKFAFTLCWHANDNYLELIEFFIVFTIRQKVKDLEFVLSFSLKGQLCFFPKAVNSTSAITNVNKKNLNFFYSLYMLLSVHKKEQCYNVSKLCCLSFEIVMRALLHSCSPSISSLFKMNHPKKKKHRCI